MQVVKARLGDLAARVPRFRWLRKAGIDAAMLVRTGGKQAMMHGGAIQGVSNALLRDRRRTATAAPAPPGVEGVKTSMWQ